MKKIVVSALGLLALVTGCSASTGTSEGGGEGAQTAQEPQVFQETVVRTAADGSQLVYTRPITLEQELADNAARQAERAGGAMTAKRGLHAETAMDSSCATSDMWLYDRAGGSGNRVCVSGSGFQNLSTTYFHCAPHIFCEKVAGNVQSFWPGNEGGYFESEGGSWCTEYFNAWDSLTPANSCGVTANYLGIQPIIQ